VKLFLWLAAVGSVAWGMHSKPPIAESWAIVLSGDTFGYLSPCGCVKPMSGGIRRRVTVIRQMAEGQKVLILDTGGLVKDQSRQSEIKAETLAQAMKLAGVNAVHLSEDDRRLGDGVVEAVARLSQATLLGGSEFFELGPFVVAGLSAESGDSLVRRLVAQAETTARVPVLLFAGSKSEAAATADRFPSLRLIVYRAETTPPTEPTRVGKTWLITPGEKGKSVLRLFWNGQQFENLEVRGLGPDIHDDPDAKRVYSTYQRRVADEHLFEKMPRQEGTAFAGNASCISCHQEEGKVWKTSRHAKALKTLEDDGHDRDPECVGCHVVGSDVTTGFMSRKETPSLTDVGCESCHGPGAVHSMAPKESPMPKIGVESCMKCHVPNHSPGFDFDAYWKKIQH